MEMSTREKKYWKIRAALEELCHVQDTDVAKNPALRDFLDVCAKVLLKFQESGPEEMFQETKFQALKEMGVAILRPKGTK